ncbi:MAG: periplasmic heavy metal sensor [Candidatus Cloacimonetes bacterium]|nr:periplasmic heavy metal sensor [Candidatus Cloacimonadota bacterium]
MSKQWIVILLLISLAFNLAVLGIFLYTSIYHKPPFCPPGMRPPHEMGRPDLPDRDKDKDKFPFAFENREEIKALRDTFMLKRREFMQIMRNEPFNEKEALAAMETSLKAQEGLEKKLGTSLIEKRKKMSPEEAKEFFERRKDRFRRRYRKDRFDHDKSREPNQERR